MGRPFQTGVAGPGLVYLVKLAADLRKCNWKVSRDTPRRASGLAGFAQNLANKLNATVYGPEQLSLVLARGLLSGSGRASAQRPELRPNKRPK